MLILTNYVNIVLRKNQKKNQNSIEQRKRNKMQIEDGDVNCDTNSNITSVKESQHQFQLSSTHFCL